LNSDDATERFAAVLNRLGAEYVVVGSFSVNVYADPRSTLDADFVLKTDEHIDLIRAAVEPDFKLDPQVGFETKFMTTRFLFRHVETGFKIEVFVLSDDPFDRARFDRRVRTELDGLVLYFPQVEDVIVQKLRWARPKDRLDVQGLLKKQADRLDWAYLHRWCDEHDTRGLLDELRAETGV